jgi:hypothetical protein
VRCRNRSVVRTGLLALYYTTILLALLGMYSLGAVAPSSFVYQGF